MNTSPRRYRATAAFHERIAAEYAKRGNTRDAAAAKSAARAANWSGRALRLFFRLNADLLNYTPRSFRARRAARLMPRLVAAMEQRA